MTVVPGFHESWYNLQQLEQVCQLAQQTAHLSGAVLEIGAWEGFSTIHIANAIYPQFLHVVDHFQGQADTPATQQTARERDIFAQYVANVREYTKGNIFSHKLDWRDYMARCPEQLRFVHLDDGHGFDDIAGQVAALWPRVVPGGILCGDDYAAYADVHRAVRGLLPGHQANGNLWFITKQ